MPKKALMLVVLVCLVAPFIILSLYNHPQNDDYVYAAHAKYLGFADANIRWYVTWSGRYTTTALLSINPIIWGDFGAYQFITAATVILLCLSLFYFLREATRRELAAVDAAIAALALAALFLTKMPNLAEGLYLMAGDVCLHLGNILLVTVIGLLFHIERSRDGLRKTFLSAAAAVLIIAGVGTNELSMVLLDGFLLLGLLFFWLRDRRLSGRWLLFVAVSVAASAVVLFAPGNLARFQSTASHDFWLAVRSSLVQGSGYLGEWLFGTPVVLIAVLFLPAVAALSRARLPRAFHPAAVLAFSLLVYFGLFFPSFYGTGLLETRTVDIIYFYFLIAFAANVLVAVGHSRDRLGPLVASLTSGRSLVIALLIGAAFVIPPSHLRTAYHDLLSGTASGYDRELWDRYRMIRECRTLVCEVPRLRNRPASIFYFENAVDEKEDTPWYQGYRDNGYAALFGKRRIRLADRDPAPSAPVR